MSALRSAIQELANEDLDDLHVDQLADDLVEIELVSGLLETQRVRRLAVYGSKGGPLSHGFSSLTAFLSGPAVGWRQVGPAVPLPSHAHASGLWTKTRSPTDYASIR